MIYTAVNGDPKRHHLIQAYLEAGRVVLIYNLNGRLRAQQCSDKMCLIEFLPHTVQGIELVALIVDELESI